MSAIRKFQNSGKISEVPTSTDNAANINPELQIKALSGMDKAEYDARVQRYYKLMFGEGQNTQDSESEIYEGIDWNQTFNADRGSARMSDFVKALDHQDKVSYALNALSRGSDELNAKDWTKDKWTWRKYTDAAQYGAAIDNLKAYLSDPNFEWDLENDDNNRAHRRAFFAAGAEELEALFNINYRGGSDSSDDTPATYTNWEPNKQFDFGDPDKNDWEIAEKLFAAGPQQEGTGIIPRYNNNTKKWEYHVTDGQRYLPLQSASDLDWGFGNDSGYYAYQGSIYNDDGTAIGTAPPQFLEALKNRTFGKVGANPDFLFSPDIHDNSILNNLDGLSIENGDGPKYSIYADYSEKIKNLNGTLIGMYGEQGSTSPEKFALHRGGQYYYGNIDKGSDGKMVLRTESGDIPLGDYNSRGSVKAFEKKERSERPYRYGSRVTATNFKDWNKDLEDDKFTASQITNEIEKPGSPLTLSEINSFRNKIYSDQNGSRVSHIMGPRGDRFNFSDAKVNVVLDPNGNPVTLKGRDGVRLMQLEWWDGWFDSLRGRSPVKIYLYIDESGQIIKTASGRNVPRNKEGGIIKFQPGGRVSWDDALKQVQDSYNAMEQSEIAANADIDPNKAFLEKYRDKGSADLSSDEFSKEDIAEIGALFADAISVGVGLIPGAHLWAAGTGAVSSAVQFGADVSRDGMDWGDWGRLGGNVAMDAFSVMPFGKIAKSSRAAIRLGKWAPHIIQSAMVTGAITAGQGQQAKNALDALASGNPKNATADDYRALMNAFSIITHSGLKLTSKAAHMKNKAATSTKVTNEITVGIKGADGKMTEVKVDIGDADALSKYKKMSTKNKKAELEKLTKAQHADATTGEGIEILTPDVNGWIRGRFGKQGTKPGEKVTTLDADLPYYRFNNGLARWNRALDSGVRMKNNNAIYNSRGEVSGNLDVDGRLIPDVEVTPTNRTNSGNTSDSTPTSETTSTTKTNTKTSQAKAKAAAKRELKNIDKKINILEDQIRTSRDNNSNSALSQRLALTRLLGQRDRLINKFTSLESASKKPTNKKNTSTTSRKQNVQRSQEKAQASFKESFDKIMGSQLKALPVAPQPKALRAINTDAIILPAALKRKFGGVLKFQGGGNTTTWTRLGTPIDDAARQGVLSNGFNTAQDIQRMFEEWNMNNQDKTVHDFANEFNRIQSSYNTNVYDPSNGLQTRGYQHANVGTHQNDFHTFANGIDQAFRKGFLTTDNSDPNSEINKNTPNIADNVVGEVTKQRYLDNAQAQEAFNSWLRQHKLEYRLAGDGDTGFTRSASGKGAQYGIFALRDVPQKLGPGPTPQLDIPIAKVPGTIDSPYRPQTPTTTVSSGGPSEDTPQQSQPQRRALWDPTPGWQFAGLGAAINANNKQEPSTWNPKNPFRINPTVTGDIGTQSMYQNLGNNAIRTARNFRTSNGNNMLAGLLEATKVANDNWARGHLANMQAVKESRYRVDQAAMQNAQNENSVSNDNIHTGNQYSNAATQLKNQVALANGRAWQGLFKEFASDSYGRRQQFNNMLQAEALDTRQAMRRNAETEMQAYQSSLGKQMDMLSMLYQDPNTSEEEKARILQQLQGTNDQAFGKINEQGHFVPGTIQMRNQNVINQTTRDYHNQLQSIPSNWSWLKGFGRHIGYSKNGGNLTYSSKTKK